MKTDLPVLGLVPAIGIISGIVLGFVFLGPGTRPQHSAAATPPSGAPAPSAQKAAAIPGYAPGTWEADADAYLCHYGLRPGCARRR